ncbi:MAG: RES family NAD+ phosphorylase [Pseudomonadota bacterium]
MIVTAIDTVAYRVHDPRWAFDPTSGAGAGKYGGRANRLGINAIYLSMELETALNEYKQLDALMPPALMVSYLIKVESIIDYRGGFTNTWNALWQDFYCDWRKMRFNDGIEPPSWVIGDQVLAMGAKGIMFKSVLTGGTNLVLYNDALTASDSIEVHDPNHALPKNQTSWE